MSKQTIIATVVLLTIERSREVTISDTVFEHEVPILELIHGAENVNVTDDDYHAIELPDNATQEYQRLLSKYGDKYKPVIDQVFPGGARDVGKELGMTLGRDSFKKQSEAVIHSRLPPRPGEKQEHDDASNDVAVQRAAAALVQAARPAAEAPSITGPASPPPAAEVTVDDGSEELSHAELREELTRRGIEHKGNAKTADLQQLLDDAKEVDGKTLGG